MRCICKKINNTIIRHEFKTKRSNSISFSLRKLIKLDIASVPIFALHRQFVIVKFILFKYSSKLTKIFNNLFTRFLYSNKLSVSEFKMNSFIFIALFVICLSVSDDVPSFKGYSILCYKKNWLINYRMMVSRNANE